MNYTVNVKLMHCKYVLLQLTRPAQDLLMSLALNCNSHSTEDVEVISNLIRMRLKTKPLANHYVTCIKYVHFLEYLILFQWSQVQELRSTQSSLTYYCCGLIFVIIRDSEIFEETAFFWGQSILSCSYIYIVRHKIIIWL